MASGFIKQHSNAIICGNVLTELRKFPDECIDCIITSPPYYGLRDYGKETETIWGEDRDCEHIWGKEYCSKLLYGLEDERASFCQKCGVWKGQLGLEPTPKMYLDHLLKITAELKRVLKKTGTMWWNHGDSYGGSGGSGGDYNEGGLKEEQPKVGRMETKNYEKSLLLQNYRLVQRMIDEQQWILRNQLIWYKPNVMPSSVKDRFMVDYEPVFFFVKSNETQYWVNEKTGLVVDKQPKGIHGIEGKDWEWRECNQCKGKGCEGRRKERRICINGQVKYNFWEGKDYWFEPQYEPHIYYEIDSRRKDFNLPSPTIDKHLEISQVGKTRHGRAKSEDYNPLGRNKRCVWKIPTQPFSMWKENARLVHVAQGEVSDGTKHIVFPNCPEHGDLLDSVSSGVCDECVGDVMNRIKRIDGYLGQEQVADFFPIVKPLVYYSWEHNSGYSRLKYLFSAKLRSNENYKKAHVLLTNLPYSSFLKILSRIDDKPDALLLSVLYLGMNGNKISLGGMDAHLLDKIPYRNTDKPLCSYCQFYRIETEKSSHFATFPEKLIEPMIKAGCPEFICKKCGKAREKIYKASGGTIGKSWHDHKNGHYKGMMQYGENSLGAKGTQDYKVEFQGYTDCGCSHEDGWNKGIVLDPFMGSGTVAAVARKLGRNWIGIEINKEYVKIAQKRLRQAIFEI